MVAERPGDPRARLGLAHALVAVGRDDEARTALEEVLARDRDHAGAAALLLRIGAP